MTVPPLPATQTASTVAPAASANDARALLAFLRDTPPSIHGVTGNLATTSTVSLIADMTAATYRDEVGTWVKGTTTSTRLDVPQPGLYLITVGVVVHTMASPSGRFLAQITAFLNSGATEVTLDGRNVSKFYNADSNIQYGSTMCLARIAAGGGFSITALQDSGVTQNDTINFNAVWLSA